MIGWLKRWYYRVELQDELDQTTDDDNWYMHGYDRRDPKTEAWEIAQYRRDYSSGYDDINAA